MTVGEMLKMMRDPLGAPFYPPALQVLLVVTWVLHIFFVTAALGTSLFSIVGFVWRRRDELALKLARIAARLTPNMLGLGIVTGIAPLLFVQTIYDPL
jgi:cytochrome bd-type quinol oxidase subunit 1